MAEYLRIKNDNLQTVIDDNWKVPPLLARVSVATNVPLPRPPNINDVRNLDWYWDWQGSYIVKVADSLRGLGFDYDDTDKNFWLVSLGLMAFGRPVGHSEVFYCTTNVSKRMNPDGSGRVQYVLNANCRSMSSSVVVEIAVYAMNLKLVPSKVGLHIYNESGELIFDAMRAGMQNIGILEGGLNLGESVARSYTINTPAGLDSNNIFISYRSKLPYYAGFTYSSSGVRMDDSCYSPRMYINPTNVKIDLVRLKSVGRSTSYSFGGYFENVIYVPQSSGIYI